jgi:hypothetical protein
LKKWAEQATIERIKLQVLHWADGITAMATEKQVKESLMELKNAIHELEGPREVDLFGADDSKEMSRKLLTARIKTDVLNYILGVEKKLG